jgi:hypothetical protein
MNDDKNDNNDEHKNDEHKNDEHKNDEYKYHEYKNDKERDKMNLMMACEILELIYPCSPSEIRKAYYKAARKHHPDHNRDTFIESNARFLEINEAYLFLDAYVKVEMEQVKDEMMNESQQKNQYNIFFFDYLIEHLKQLDLKEISLNALDGLDKNTSIHLLDYIDNYSELLGLEEEFVCLIRQKIREKTENDIVIILKPSIENILNDELHKLDYEGETYYIPLWHDELRYDLCKNKSLVVKCIPDLSNHISIDYNNNLHVRITVPCIQNLFNLENLTFELGGKVFEIPVGNLKIKRKQNYTLYEKGIALINSNIYEIKRRGNIIVLITIDNS